MDNLHLSAKGLHQVSGIILSNLYQVLAPDSYKPGLGINLKSKSKDEMPKAVTKLKVVSICSLSLAEE